MPYRSKVESRLYQREYKRRLRGFYNKPERRAVKPNSVKPFVKPARQSKALADLRTDLPGGECIWGWDDTQGEPPDDSLRTDLPGGDCWWGFNDTKNTRK